MPDLTPREMQLYRLIRDANAGDPAAQFELDDVEMTMWGRLDLIRLRAKFRAEAKRRKDEERDGA